MITQTNLNKSVSSKDLEALDHVLTPYIVDGVKYVKISRKVSKAFWELYKDKTSILHEFFPNANVWKNPKDNSWRFYYNEVPEKEEKDFFLYNEEKEILEAHKREELLDMDLNPATTLHMCNKRVSIFYKSGIFNPMF
jgi:hypothetical protein